VKPSDPSAAVVPTRRPPTLTGTSPTGSPSREALTTAGSPGNGNPSVGRTVAVNRSTSTVASPPKSPRLTATVTAWRPSGTVSCAAPLAFVCPVSTPSRLTVAASIGTSATLAVTVSDDPG
jgi:hypothetical protein